MMRAVKLIVVGFFVTTLFLTHLVMAKEEGCIDLVKKAIKQILGENVTITEVSKPVHAPGYSQPFIGKGLQVGNRFFYCFYNPNIRAGGETLPRTDGGFDIAINSVVKKLEVIKMFVYHELQHVRLIEDGTGYRDPDNNIIGPRVNEKGEKIPSEPEFEKVRPCQEAITCLRTAIYAQENLSKEFPNITKDANFFAQIDEFLENVRKCKRVKFQARWRTIGETLKGELEQLKEKAMEKLLLKAGKDNRVSDGELKAIREIGEWLGVDKGEFERIRKEYVSKKLESETIRIIDSMALPEGVTQLLQNEQILFIVEDKRTGELMLAKGVEIKDGRLSLLEQQPLPTLLIKVDDEVLTSLSNSLDPEYAIKVAIKDGEIRIEKVPFTPFIEFTQRIASAAPQLKDTLQHRGKDAKLKVNPKGVKYLEAIGKGEVMMLNKHLSPIGYSTKGAQRLASYKPEQLSKNAGIYAESLEDLGVATADTAPEAVERTELKIELEVEELLNEHCQESESFFDIFSEVELPEIYEPWAHINAKDKKTGEEKEMVLILGYAMQGGREGGWICGTPFVAGFREFCTEYAEELGKMMEEDTVWLLGDEVYWYCSLLPLEVDFEMQEKWKKERREELLRQNAQKLLQELKSRAEEE